VWITLLIQERLLGLCLVYAPNISLDRLNLWERMVSSLLDAEWFVGGDFNMVEWEGGDVGVVISGSEKHAWARCKAGLQLFDPKWWKKGIDYGGWFTWSNLRKMMDRVEAQLDRVYGR
jgi:hypothetical protein